jgi:hypothetical protein
MRVGSNPHKKVRLFPKPRSRKEKRRPWTSKEDDSMRRLVEENGTKQWTIIAQKLNECFPTATRTGKQCRERWHNHLNPGINKDTWALDEEVMLFSTHEKLGNKWAEISNFLPGRTDNSIKNHFYSTLRKQFRVQKGMDSTREQLKKHCAQLAASVLAGLKKRVKKREEQDFVKSQEEFFDSFPAMMYSPPDLDDEFSYEDGDFVVCGHQIDLPTPMTPISVEEAPMEFAWLETGELPDEVFLMPLNTSEMQGNNF